MMDQERTWNSWATQHRHLHRTWPWQSKQPILPLPPRKKLEVASHFFPWTLLSTPTNWNHDTLSISNFHDVGLLLHQDEHCRFLSSPIRDPQRLGVRLDDEIHAGFDSNMGTRLHFVGHYCLWSAPLGQLVFSTNRAKILSGGLQEWVWLREIGPHHRSLHLRHTIITLSKTDSIPNLLSCPRRGPKGRLTGSRYGHSIFQWPANSQWAALCFLGYRKFLLPILTINLVYKNHNHTIPARSAPQ